MKMDETITALNGTYCRNGYIYASIAGTVQLTQFDNKNVCLIINIINYYYYYYYYYCYCYLNNTIVYKLIFK
jgi:exosome complex RNA-binding protein Rrp4